MEDRVTPDDPVVCGLCQHETSVAMIAVHLERHHGIDPSEIANAPVLDEDSSLDWRNLIYKLEDNE